MKILIDPYVIAIPPLHSPTHRVLSYVEGIEVWTGATSVPSVKVLYSPECISSLMESDQFPIVHKLAELFATAGITQYDAQTVSRLSMSLFDSWKDIEDILRISAITCQLTVTPTSFVDRMPCGVSRSFLHCLGRVVVQQSAGDMMLAELSIGSSADTDKTENKLVIQGIITHVEIGRSICTNDLVLGHLPIKVKLELPILLEREHILRSIDWAVIWRYPRWAIEKAYYSALPLSDRATYALGNFDVRSRFLNTITDLGLHTQSGRIRSIYETCALVICGYASKVRGINPRPLRRGSRDTDGAKGMRADISQERAGYRLHYWKRRDGTIELSCVNVHNDATIY